MPDLTFAPAHQLARLIRDRQVSAIVNEQMVWRN